MVMSEVSEQQARELVELIARHARAHNHRALLEIDADPATEELLELLPTRTTEDAKRHLQGARTWRRRQSEKMSEKLDAVQTALEGLDLRLARGILRKIDSSVLDDSQHERYNELVLGVEARAVELESIQSQVPTADQPTSE